MGDRAERATGTCDDPWMAAMRRGDFAGAWAVSDAILSERRASAETCWHWPRHQQFVWTGAPLAKRRVLVRCYHGLGDTLQFIRFAAPLRRIASHVTVWVQPALLPIVATAPGVDAVLPLHDGTPEARYDVDTEIMELAHALRVTERMLGPVPYLFPPDADPSDDRSSRGKHRVGFVWKAGGWDPGRSVPTDTMRDLFRRLAARGVSPFILQRGLGDDELRGLPAVDIGSDDVLVTAARMRALDLVVSVDTMPAHLAGALGLPCITLLRAECDWRWMTGRDDTPWYPTMRLLRVPPGSDWADAVAALETMLTPSHGSGNHQSEQALAKRT
ncbi:glycosyltransferase family 9 protein [Rhodoplanes roseus]|uniref:ADP-heptose--LPS heptosyltransferase n=1 Tax=Rhodoplanes roseus TaxID=29409 RepID=A0A327LBG8_9BRAD|nr:glycosyltransferase family 9 protein [Rhodoplanes roseus]RAI45088.1 hypothetical protein CH341_05910 [Rhodoplanes roseus]